MILLNYSPVSYGAENILKCAGASTLYIVGRPVGAKGILSGLVYSGLSLIWHGVGSWPLSEGCSTICGWKLHQACQTKQSNIHQTEAVH